MSTPLYCHPVWADAKTVARLFGMAESTFRDHVSAGLFPQGKLVGGKRLWRVADLDEALVNLGGTEKDDPVLQRIRGIGHGQATKGKRDAA